MRSLNVSEFCRKLNISRNTFYRRLKNGWGFKAMVNHYQKNKRAVNRAAFTDDDYRQADEVAKMLINQHIIIESCLSDLWWQFKSVKKVCDVLGVTEGCFRALIAKYAPKLATVIN